MNTIKLCLDEVAYKIKPKNFEIARLSNEIGGSVKEVNVTTENLNKLILDIGRDGHTFCPATFKDGHRHQESFEQQQIIALDFDNDKPDSIVSLEEVRRRATKYGLPVWFAYDSLRSTNHNKFRVVFLNDVSITHRKVAEAMQLAMGTIFPEADPLCYKDVSKMYFGGKGVFYQDKAKHMISVESVFRGLTYFLEDQYKTHYKEKLFSFSQKTGIALNENGLLDVMVEDALTEHPGATLSSDDGKNSPNPIIYIPNIIANGEIFPNKHYHIRLNDCTGKYSVTSGRRPDVTDKKYKNHNLYRRSDIERMTQVCRLFREFESGSRDMTHDELFGILNNLLHVDSGITTFKNIQAKYPEWYDSDRRASWKRHISFNKRNGYRPSSCDGFCPYRDKCDHGKNILSTVHPRPGMMERIPGYREEFHPIEEVQDDTYEAISRAFRAEDTKVHVIKSQTGAGKSHSYLQLMADNPEERFLIAVPTNRLKDEICRKADRMGIDVRKTPSLEEIKDEIPSKVWKRIQRLRDGGQHKAVHSYIVWLINKVLLEPGGKDRNKKMKAIACLREYMKDRDKLKFFKGNLITTQRYSLSMDAKRLKEFDVIIIDEDILFKSVITNQEEIPVSVLEKWSAETTNRPLAKKIKRLLKLAKDQRCIELDSIEWDDESDGDELPPFDVPSFCRAERFYLRRASEDQKLEEDAVVYLKPVSFKDDVKYIIVSATADEAIYRQYFGEDRVEFYECKKAKNMGTLHQYYGKSMSRSSIKSDDGIVKRLMNRFDMDEDHVITFMCEKIGRLHFGNAEGSNTLEGEDILVVGTPYHADFIYKLAAFTMGMDFDEDEKVGLQVVTHNGYRFRFDKRTGLR